MKSESWDEGRAADHREYVTDGSAREALDALVTTASERLNGCRIDPAWHGQIREFRYFDVASGEQPFAFIVNRGHMLFFVRAKGLARVQGGFSALQQGFKTVRETTGGEWTVRIETKAEAELLNRLLFEGEVQGSGVTLGIPDGITRDDVIDAIRRLDEGAEHGFGPSLKYDLVIADRRYAPKAVVGLASERLTGRVLIPSDFSGGQDSKSTRILRDLGFSVESKPGTSEATDAELPEMSNHWWVNHKQTFRQETAGNYLWSPRTNQNGARNRTYDNMTQAVVGDVVFSYADGMIKAVGVVTAPATTSSKPDEFGTAGENWNDNGWRLPVVFTVLDIPLRPKEHMDALAPLLPERHSPIRANGDGNQGVYLAAVPAAMAAELRRLLSGQVEQIEAKHKPRTLVDQDQDQDAQADREVFARTDIGSTQKQTLVNARRGQGLFRERVIHLEGRCRMTGVTLTDHLRASHIKPWKDSSDFEKLDGNNGLLLSPHLDHLFDQGYISFTDFGDLILSVHCPAALIKAWGVDESLNVGPFRLAQRVYLAHHRDHVFKQ